MELQTSDDNISKPLLHASPTRTQRNKCFRVHLHPFVSWLNASVPSTRALSNPNASKQQRTSSRPLCLSHNKPPHHHRAAKETHKPPNLTTHEASGSTRTQTKDVPPSGEGSQIHHTSLRSSTPQSCSAVPTGLTTGFLIRLPRHTTQHNTSTISPEARREIP